jgi:predicted DNA-binding antitoxin AbrB/MazE fold protein
MGALASTGIGGSQR